MQFLLFPSYPRPCVLPYRHSLPDSYLLFHSFSHPIPQASTPAPGNPSHMSPSAETSPGRVARRVLADKHTNALWPAVQHAETPVKPRQDALVTSRTVGHATHAGQKRSRDQVHELATKASDLQTSTFAASPHREGTFQILEDPKSPTTGTQSPVSVFPIPVANNQRFIPSIFPTPTDCRMIGPARLPPQALCHWKLEQPMTAYRPGNNGRHHRYSPCKIS